VAALDARLRGWTQPIGLDALRVTSRVRSSGSRSIKPRGSMMAPGLPQLPSSQVIIQTKAGVFA